MVYYYIQRMRKFRQSLKEHEFKHFQPSFDTRQHKYWIHLLSLVDNCSQIIRDDRIWLRNKVKENDQEVIKILKTAYKNPQRHLDAANLKQLQINLRKYISKIKDKQKEDQLIKFKQNILVTNLKKKDRLSQQSSFLSYGKSYFQDNQLCRSLPKQSGNLSRLNQPIQEEDSSEKDNSYRSRSSQPRSHDQRGCSYKQLERRKKAKNQPPKNKSDSKINREFINKQSIRKAAPCLKQSRSKPILIENTFNSYQKILKNQEDGRLNNSKSNIYSYKDQLLTFKPSLNTYNIQNNSAYQIVQKVSKCGLADQILKPTGLQISLLSSQSASQSRLVQSLKYKQDDENLFTSPELLMECRKFIARNSMSRCRETSQNQRKDKDANNMISSNLNQEPVERPCQLLKDFKFGFMENNINFEQQLIKEPKRAIQDQFAQDIFDSIVGGKKSVVDFGRLLCQKYERTATLLNILDRCSNEMSLQQIGDILGLYCGNQSNAIKELYNYLDLDRKGFVTVQDLSVFLNQVLESEDENMFQVGKRVFEMACRDGRVQYWNLYQMKQSEQMKELLRFLSQFQFQIQG